MIEFRTHEARVGVARRARHAGWWELRLEERDDAKREGGIADTLPRSTVCSRNVDCFPFP